MENVFVNILLVLGGATGQFLLSTLLMPKKDKREADQHFIDTLIQRVSNLEGRLDEQSKQLTCVMEENARLKIELEYLKKENEELKQENGR